MMDKEQITAMVANLRAFNTDASRNEAADALEAQAAEIIKEQRISNERGNHIEFTLLPQMAAMTMQLADRDAEIARLAAARLTCMGEFDKKCRQVNEAIARAEAAEAKVAGLTDALHTISSESHDRHADDEAAREGDWDWLIDESKDALK